MMDNLHRCDVCTGILDSAGVCHWCKEGKLPPHEPVPEVRTDEPGLDGTNEAHPAWWRGQERGAEGVIEVLTEILDGKSHTGTFGSPALEALARRLSSPSGVALTKLVKKAYLDGCMEACGEPHRHNWNGWWAMYGKSLVSKLSTPSPRDESGERCTCPRFSSCPIHGDEGATNANMVDLDI